MHHPEICDILLIIQDFLLMADDRSNCEIIPLPCHREGRQGEIVRVRQIHVRRKLSSGWLEFIIHGLDKDSDLITLEYLTSLEPRTCIKTIEIGSNKYFIGLVQDAIREIIILDKQPKFDSLDSIRDMERLIQTSLTKPS
jgi:hypothetical protein